MFKKRIARVIQAIVIVTIAAFFTGALFMAGIPVKNATDNLNDKKISPQARIGSSDISTQNAYTGTGAPLNLQEWADSKNTTTSRSLIGSGTTSADIQLAAGWTGYKMYTNVYNLYDTKEWANYTGMSYDTASDTINHNVWYFHAQTGTYAATGYDGASATANYCAVNLNPYHNGGDTYYYTYENGWWQQILSLPRGTIIAMWVAYSYDLVSGNASSGGYTFTQWGMIQSFASINGSEVYNRTAQQMNYANPNTWRDTGVQPVRQSIINTLNNIAGGSACKINFSIGLQSTQSFEYLGSDSAVIQVRNCRIFIEAYARPTQAGLQIAFSGAGGNSAAKNSIQNIGTSYGTGQLNYSATPTNWQATGGTNLDIISTIYTTETQNYPSDGLETVQFNMYQIIYGWHYRNTQINPNSLAANGTTFVSANNSKANWTIYFYDRPPQMTGNQQNYADYLFNGSKPADWQIYSVLDSQPFNTTKNLKGSIPVNTTKWLNGSTFITMPKAYAGFYGYWTLSAWSPNYVQSMTVPSSIYQGKSISITGMIKASNLTDKYISSTRAMLTIKFPNGTVWANVTQTAYATNRQVNFPAITIPSSGSQYVAGTYTAIMTWNNSRSGYSLNETGCMVKTFTVFHNATLIPQYTTYWNNLNTVTALPIELRYVDTGSNDISGALIVFKNFNNAIQNFTHITGYYNYLTLLNCSKGKNGLNKLTINASSSSFQPITITIQVEVVRTTNFTIDQYPSLSCQWNDNFSLTLRYNDSGYHTGIGIKSSKNITVGWPVEANKYWVNMAKNSSGVFTLVFNTTGATPNTVYTVPISIKSIGYQNQTVTMTITITPRLTSLSLTPIGNLPFGSTLNVSGTYQEISSGNLISNKTNMIRVYAWISQGSTKLLNCTITNLGGTTKTTYTFILNSALLINLGTYTLNVNFRWKGVPYYSNITSTLSFTLVQRTTQAYASNTYGNKYWATNFTIPISYIDVNNGTSISSASNVHITIHATDNGVTNSYMTKVDTKTWIGYVNGNWDLNFSATYFGREGAGFTIIVYVNWTANKAPYYVNQTVSFSITIATPSTLIYIVDSSKQTAPSGYNNTLTFNLINQQSGSGISGVENNFTISSSKGFVITKGIYNGTVGHKYNNGSYVLNFNLTSVAADTVTFSLNITMTFYQSIVNYNFTLIKIAPVPLVDFEKVDTVYLGQSMNIVIFYHLQGVTTTGILNAKITVQNGPKSGNWSAGTFTYLYDSATHYYNITFTPSFTHPYVNQAGSYTEYINCSSSQGSNSQLRVNFVVNPIPTVISGVYFNQANYTSTLPSYTSYIGDTVNLTIHLKNTFNGSAVQNAIVTLTKGSWSGTFSKTGLNYSIIINTNTFGLGPFIFTVSTSKNNFQPASQEVKLEIDAVSTLIQPLLLNGTSTTTKTLYYGSSINITFVYENTHKNVAITNSTVSIVLTGGHVTFTNGTTSGSFRLSGSNKWYAIIPTSQIGVPGTYSMTLTAGLTNYQTAIASFVISISQIPTNLIAYNSSGKQNVSYTVYWGSTFKVGLHYINTNTSQNIQSASIAVTGAFSYAYSVNGYWYNYTFNSSSVTPNVYTISLSASLSNYTSSTVLITVSVLSIIMSLSTYNGTIQTNSFSQIYGLNVTVTLRMLDMNNNPALLVNWITNYGKITSISGRPGYYKLQVNTTSWSSIGIVQFTVTGSKSNYTSASAVITINILAIPTAIKVYINGHDRTSTLQETINFLENFNITVYYQDINRSVPIKNAIVSLGFSNTTSSYQFLLGASGTTGNYTRGFNSGNLGAATGNQYIFSLSANKTNYNSIFARINIFYNPIPTALNISCNGTYLTRNGNGNTINVYYCDQVILLVNLTSYLEGFNITSSMTTVDISAVVNQQIIQGTYSTALHSYVISINVNNTIYDMTAVLTHQVLVVGDANGYKGDTFSVLVNVLSIPTNMTVLINSTNYSNFVNNGVVFLKNTLLFQVYYERFYHYNGYQALDQISGTATLTFLNEISHTEVQVAMQPKIVNGVTLPYFELAYPLALDTFTSGIENFYIIASLSNYQTQQISFSLNINNVNTTMTVLVNGKTQTQLNHVTLKSTLRFSVAYLETDTLQPIQGSTVQIKFVNDTNGNSVTENLAYNSTTGTYMLGGNGLVLDLKTFFAQLKIFTITAQLNDYEVRTNSFVVNIQKISVFTNLNLSRNVNVTGTTITVQPAQTIDFRIDLFDTFANLSFTDIAHITVSVTPQFTGQEVVMTPEVVNGNYTGIYYITLTAPANPAQYTLIVKINVTDAVLLQQYQFASFSSYTLNVVRLTSNDYTWLVIVLLIGIIVIATWFILYQVRFKYPPMVRKIMDLRRSVARGRDASKIRPSKVKTREENIFNHYAGVINGYSFLQTRDTRYAARAPGYAPVPDEKTNLEWEIPALEGPELPQIVPKGMKKGEVAKGYVSLPPTTPAAAPVQPAPGEEQPSVPLVKPPVRPMKPVGAPTVPARPPVKPIGLAALPKPSVAPLKAYRTPATAVKPAPVTEGAETHENLYQQLVLLEQKRYKAERSIRDLDAKHNKGLVNDTDYKNYMEKINSGLDKIKNQISDIRRKLISF